MGIKRRLKEKEQLNSFQLTVDISQQVLQEIEDVGLLGKSVSGGQLKEHLICLNCTYCVLIYEGDTPGQGKPSLKRAR